MALILLKSHEFKDPEPIISGVVMPIPPIAEQLPTYNTRQLIQVIAKKDTSFPGGMFVSENDDSEDQLADLAIGYLKARLEEHPTEINDVASVLANSIFNRGDLHQSALTIAITQRNLELVQFLLKRPELDVNNLNPLFLATDLSVGNRASRDSFEITRLLLAHKNIDVNQLKDGKSALELSTDGRNDPDPVFELLLNQNAIKIEPGLVNKLCGHFVLYPLVFKIQPKTIAKLIEKGAEFDLELVLKYCQRIQSRPISPQTNIPIILNAIAKRNMLNSNNIEAVIVCGYNLLRYSDALQKQVDALKPDFRKMHATVCKLTKLFAKGLPTSVLDDVKKSWRKKLNAYELAESIKQGNINAFIDSLKHATDKAIVRRPSLRFLGL